MSRGKYSNSIPVDLIMEISSRLPAKSITRFCCVSKLWSSIFHSPYFKDLFLTRSSKCPRLLFVIKETHNGEWLFFSSPQPHNPCEKTSLVVSAGFRLKSSKEWSRLDFCGYASGLICFTHHMWSDNEKNIVNVICSPSTAQRFSRFDPIGKQFKVLSNHKILTLKADNIEYWRKIRYCSLTHDPNSEPICINGVLYYLAQDSSTIVCFDVRSETYKCIKSKGNEPKLINYKGKLGGVHWNYYAYGGISTTIELHLWILEDEERQEWSDYFYTWHDNRFVDRNDVYVAGVTATGEVVVSTKRIRVPFCVLFINPVKNTFQSVELEGFGDMIDIKNNKVYAFVDHVEDLNFDIGKTIYDATSTSPPEEKRKHKRSSTSFEAQR
ncbi:hypothetical protein EUTSA_v10019539mg, partial [Eutrema salsugineum]